MESEFWKDLRKELEDPESREAYIKESERIQGIDMEMNEKVTCGWCLGSWPCAKSPDCFAKVNTDNGPEETDVPEDRYEAIHLIIKSRPDGKAWFDVLFDLITEPCEGTDSDEDDCTCGLASMGGSGGTLQQCYDYTTTVGHGLQPIDLAKVILFLNRPLDADYVIPEIRNKVLDWAEKEVAFEAYFENREWENEEDEEEDGSDTDYILPEEFEPYFSNESIPDDVLNILKGNEK